MAKIKGLSAAVLEGEEAQATMSEYVAASLGLLCLCAVSKLLASSLAVALEMYMTA